MSRFILYLSIADGIAMVTAIVLLLAFPRRKI